MRRGRFIVFEGLDGSGTSTQVYKLRDYIHKKGIKAEASNEPTNGPIGSAIRLAILGRVSIDAKALALAFASDRIDHLHNQHNGIIGALEKGVWVISDRYVLSSLAYQGIDIDDEKWLAEINRYAITPDLTVFVDTPVNICTERIDVRSSEIELYHSKDKLSKIALKFIQASSIERFVGTLVVADGSNNPEIVFNSYISYVDRMLSESAL